MNRSLSIETRGSEDPVIKTTSISDGCGDRRAGLQATITLDGATTGDAFAAFVRHVLAPTRVPGQVAVLDNLRAHKRDETRAIIEGAGCLLIFLPPYSPDCSPIELAFSTIKERLRRAKSRTRETLEAAISHALAAVTARDVTGWFRHCGYCNLGLS